MNINGVPAGHDACHGSAGALHRKGHGEQQFTDCTERGRDDGTPDGRPGDFTGTAAEHGTRGKTVDRGRDAGGRSRPSPFLLGATPVSQPFWVANGRWSPDRLARALDRLPTEPGRNDDARTSLSNAGTGPLGGFIKIERQTRDGAWHDVTMEILNYGIGAPKQAGGALCSDPTPNAIIRLQRLRDNGGGAGGGGCS